MSFFHAISLQHILIKSSVTGEFAQLVARVLPGLSKDDRKGKTKKGKIIGGVVGAICAIIIVVWIYMCLRYRKKKKAREQTMLQSVEDDNKRREEERKNLGKYREGQAEEERLEKEKAEKKDKKEITE